MKPALIITDFAQGTCPYYEGCRCRRVVEKALRCDWFEDNALLRASPEVLDDYVRRIGKEAPPGALTYRGIVQFVAERLSGGAVEPSTHEASELDRRRATKVIIDAWLRIPRPHIQPKANLTPNKPQCPMERIVHRAYFLEREVFERLKGLCFTATPLEGEVKHPHQASGFTRINGEWDGVATVQGDACLDALVEVLANARRREDAGQPDPRGGVVQVAEDSRRRCRGVAATGVAGRAPASDPPGILARRCGRLPGGKADGGVAPEGH